MAELEQVFNAPVIESYGMTEASHQMASNPLPPHKRKPGSVGIAAGLEVAIMDETGNLLSPGEIGEVVIRGANVTSGYENNPQANETAFTNGWFRTGDNGYLDAENYLFLKGFNCSLKIWEILEIWARFTDKIYDVLTKPRPNFHPNERSLDS